MSVPEPKLPSMATADPSAAGEAITPQNYFYVADDLRRELQVAQVICLDT